MNNSMKAMRLGHNLTPGQLNLVEQVVNSDAETQEAILFAISENEKRAHVAITKAQSNKVHMGEHGPTKGSPRHTCAFVGCRKKVWTKGKMCRSHAQQNRQKKLRIHGG